MKWNNWPRIPGESSYFSQCRPLGSGRVPPVPWTQENLAYFVQSSERRSYIGAYPPRRHITGKRSADEEADGGGPSSALSGGNRRNSIGEGEIEATTTIVVDLGASGPPADKNSPSPPPSSPRSFSPSPPLPVRDRTSVEPYRRRKWSRARSGRASRTIERPTPVLFERVRLNGEVQALARLRETRLHTDRALDYIRLPEGEKERNVSRNKTLENNNSATRAR